MGSLWTKILEASLIPSRFTGIAQWNFMPEVVKIQRLKSSALGIWE
jgi:hypothetical protein